MKKFLFSSLFLFVALFQFVVIANNTMKSSSSTLVDPLNVIKDTPFNQTMMDVYNPNTTDLGWCSYINNATYGFSSSRVTETNGNKYYHCVTTSAQDDYHRALAEFTSKTVLPGRYKLTFRAKASAGTFYLKLGTKTSASVSLPTNLGDATAGITLSSNVLYFTPTTEWQTFTCTFDLTHTTADYLRVFFQFPQIGTFDIDDVELFPYGSVVSGLTIAGKNNVNTITTAGGSLQMVTTVTPSDAAIKAVTWSVDNPLVATIGSTGILTAKGNGTVTVTATTIDGSNISAQTVVNVSGNTLAEQVIVTGLNGVNSISTLSGGLQMTATVKPDATINKSVFWSVDNNLIATINAYGYLTAKRDGVVNVIATALDASGVKGITPITISNNPGIQSITITSPNNVNSINTAGGTLQLSVTILPDNAPNKTVSWTVDNVQLARINSTGLLTAKKDGVVKVIATALDGSSVIGEYSVTISGNGAISTSDRLSSRFIYFCTDAKCTYKTAANWTTVLTMKNSAKYKSTVVAGEYTQYAASIDNLAGSVDVMIYKNVSVLPVDNHVKVEVFHNGVSEFFYADFSTKRDGWYSLGKFDFKGDNTEYVRFWRETGNTLLPTPAVPVRFDTYYDTQTRPQTTDEQSQTVTTGFSKSGTWRNSAKAGYRTTSTPQESNTIGSVAVWNPGKLDAGKMEIYIYKPKNLTDDKYEIFHNSKVDVVYLKNLKQSNLNLVSTSNNSPLNPVVAQGWYKIGEYDFSGTGNEFVRLTKNSTDTTFVDCLMLESVKFDGTILHRTVVTTNPYTSGLYAGTYPATLEQKEKATTSAPTIGFSPTDMSSTSASMYNGSTIYSRALYLASSSTTYYWNPLIVEPGDYEFSYFAYYPTSSAVTFNVKSNGGTVTKSIPQANFVQGSFTPVGTFTFAGGLGSEYIQMTNCNRASDILLEKKISNSAILKQVAVTVHPYFKETVYDDTKDIAAQHDISFMVNKGFVSPVTDTQFSPKVSMTRAEFIKSLALMLSLNPNTALPNYADVSSTDSFKGYIGIARKTGLLYGLPDTTNIFPNAAITREVAAQILLNAMEYSGRYTNVKNLFKTKPSLILQAYTDASSISPFAREAYARMLETRVMQSANGPRLLPLKALTRAESTVLLKEFLESILGSGPHSRKTDWEFTFGDEFDGDQLDFNKWICDDFVRFDGISAKWKENCVVEDGMFKGYNFLDNHSVPYSSGNIASIFRQTYGFFEARYKYPDKAYGSHSSFWVSTPSTGGDFNFNEGTYPNAISNNNYFMTSPSNFHNFVVPTNMAADYHTIAGYLNNTDLYYGLDGKKSYDVPNYPTLYAVGKSTNVPYGVWMSTVVTYFDGPLDRDRIDGGYMGCDWVRVYKEATWLPEVEVDNCLPAQNAQKQPVSVLPVIKFNKAMDLTTLSTANIVVTEAGGAQVPTYVIQQLTPLRFRIKFSQNLLNNKTYNVLFKKASKDLITNTMEHDTIYTFSTVDANQLSVKATSNGPVSEGNNVELHTNVSGGSGVYTKYTWTGPDGFTSDLPNPIISGAGISKSGEYTVVVVDNAGVSGSASIYVSIDANGIKNNLYLTNTQIFPNPGNGNISVVDEGFASSVELMISVSDLSGKLLYKESQQSFYGSNRMDLNLSFLQAGVYFLNLKACDKQKTLKLVVKK
jgi:uncharacterized protein YjdB